MADDTITVDSSDTDGVSLDVPTYTLGDTKIPYDVLRYIPEESAMHYSFIPIAASDGVLEVGMVDPDNLESVDALNFIARSNGMPFKLYKISREDFERVVAMYRGLGGDVDRAVTDLATEQKESDKKDTKSKVSALDDSLTPIDLDRPVVSREDKDMGVSIQEDAPTIKIVSTILRYAIDGKASDIHIEPQPAGVRVRYRVDGELHTSVLLPITAHRSIVARIKILSSMRLDEQRKPQDGRFSASINGREIDFRVSTFPAYYGEKIVIRILDREAGFIPLKDIGFSPRNLEMMQKAVQRPHGLILISGPTGSGKSTTLYSMMGEVDRERRNVLSLEDPVEYYMDGVNQSQVHPEIGYTFASGLRTTLRQDPDVIMVGEIRDGETATLAIQAALTGHLVLSTIHTNDSVGTIARLIDMGVEPYLIPPVLIASVAQRLVRRLCPGSGAQVPITPSDRKNLERQMESLPEQYHFSIPDFAYDPEKTATCPTGTRGRLAVFEVMEMSPSIERVILDNPVDSKLWEAARAQGVLTMQEDAMIKAFNKQIPFSEVLALGSMMLDDEAAPQVAPEPVTTEKKPSDIQTI